MRDFSTQDAAWYLTVTRQTIWKWRKQGLLAGYTVGSRWRVSTQELEAFKRRSSVRKSKNRPSFREFAASTLSCNRVTLWSIEKRIGKKVTPGILADLLKDEGRKQGRQEMYRELRQQRRLKYPRMSEAAKRRFHGTAVMEGRLS